MVGWAEPAVLQMYVGSRFCRHPTYCWYYNDRRLKHVRAYRLRITYQSEVLCCRARGPRRFARALKCSSIRKLCCSPRCISPLAANTFSVRAEPESRRNRVPLALEPRFHRAAPPFCRAARPAADVPCAYENAGGFVIPLACLPAPQAACTTAQFHASFATVHVDESPGPECRWTGIVLAPMCSECDSVLDVHFTRFRSSLS